MLIYLSVSAFLGFLIALKLPFLLAIGILAGLFFLASLAKGIEGAIFALAPSIVSWFGAIVGWLYYLVFFHPVNLSLKSLAWFFHP